MTHRAVIHLDEGDPDKIAAVLQNASNLLAALGSGTRVELVAHGPGIALATDLDNDQLTDLLERGATLCACNNTMTAKGLTRSDLHPRATVVPSGVAHLVVRQAEGWAYLRP